MLRRVLLFGGVGVVGAFLLIQAIPYGRGHTNPPVVQEPSWASAQTRQLAVRACFDCHSNQTTWPWYSNVAPVSWLVYNDVQEGRKHLNFSEWNRPQRETREIAGAVLEGEMPPGQYLILHPSAKLSAQEKQTLASGLQTTVTR